MELLMGDSPKIVDSVTRIGPESRQSVVLAGSHCGLYAAYLAARAGVRAVILNDAGIGRERAGVAGLGCLEKLGLPAATVSHRSARIGNGADARQRGAISLVNRLAQELGVSAGMPAWTAALRFAEQAPPWNGMVASERESRVELLPADAGGPAVSLLDSVSLVEPKDHGQIVVTGSHGGLLGDRPETASKVDVFAALYNDADLGIDNAGITRLPALDARGIAAGTVSAWSARIGDGRSIFEDGFITHVNDTARRYGAEIGISARSFVERMREAARKAKTGE
jgi:hypothetical protein